MALDTIPYFLALMYDAVRSDPVLSGLAVLIIYFFIRTSLLSRRVSRLTRGGDGKTLEGTLQTLKKRIETLETHLQKNEVWRKNADARIRGTIRSVNLERFDAFPGAGGEQSFSAALIDEDGNGAVLSGIHSRDQVRVYAKPVKQFASEHGLSEEEARALTRTKNTLKNS